MDKVNPWTALVLSVFIVAWVALIISGHEVPTWMVAAGALAGKVLLGVMPQLVKAGPS